MMDESLDYLMLAIQQSQDLLRTLEAFDLKLKNLMKTENNLEFLALQVTMGVAWMECVKRQLVLD